jgi:transposase
MQSAMTYLNVRQVIPCGRVAEVCQDLFGLRPSAGSVVRAVVRFSDRVASSSDEIRDTLRQAAILHADETGVRGIARTHWLHVVSTASHSLFSHRPKRGIEGFAVAKVLPTDQGM